MIRKPQPGNCSLVPCTHGCCTRGVSACSFPSRCAAVQWRGGRASRCECMGNIRYGGVGNSGVGLQQVQACSRYMQLPCFQSLLQQPHWGNTPEMGYVAAPLDPCWVFFCQLGTGAAAFSPDLETKAVPAVGHCRMVLSCDPGLSHGSTPGRRAAGPRCPEHSFLAPSIIPRRLHPIEMAMTCCAIPARRLPWTPACLLEETLGKSRAMGLKVFRALRNSLQPPLSPSTGQPHRSMSPCHVCLAWVAPGLSHCAVRLQLSSFPLSPLHFNVSPMSKWAPMRDGDFSPASTNHSSKRLP